MSESRRVGRLKARSARRAARVKAAATAAAGYVRVSTDEQVHGHGLEVQEKAIRAFAASQGYDLVGVFSDPGVSGASRPAERPGYRAAVKSAAGIILVWMFDRLARAIVHAVTAVAELAAAGVEIRSVTEPIDTTTAMGRTIFAVLAGMAEQERAAITERTWHGRREKAGHGGYAGGAAPYGYRTDKDGGLAIDQQEAAIVKRIFDLDKQGLAHAAIARTLSAEGLRTRRGKPWRHGGIAYLLDNPKYRGVVEYLFRWGGTESHVMREGAHAAIVPASASD
jgi:site-specific DNA recombinase